MAWAIRAIHVKRSGKTWAKGAGKKLGDMTIQNWKAEFRRVIDSIWPSYDENGRYAAATAYFRDLTDEEREELK
jgi:hypothetical protein